MSYSFKGEQLPSVTTIIGQLDKSGALIGWALNCYEAKLKELIEAGEDLDTAIGIAKRDYESVSDTAKNIGKQVHDAIERYIKYGRDLNGLELKDEVQNGFLAFLEWEKENVKYWIESEVQTVNINVGYAGTYDAIFMSNDNQIVMVDFKTSKAVYDEYWLQLAAYKQARELLYGQYTIEFERGEGATFTYDLPDIIIDRVAVLRLDKDTGNPDYVVRDKVKTIHDFMAFEALTDFYYYAKKRRLKNNLRVDEIWG